MTVKEIRSILKRFNVLVENQEQLVLALSGSNNDHPWKVVARSPLTHRQWKKKEYISLKNFNLYSRELIYRWNKTRDIEIYSFRDGEWKLAAQYPAECKADCDNCHRASFYIHECKR